MTDLDYSNKWDRNCPNIQCRKSGCGLKYVFIPATLGDDSATSPVAPKNGAHCDAIVLYEANGRIYIYSKEGIPVRMAGGGGVYNFDELLGRPFYAGSLMTSSTSIPVVPVKVSDLPNDAQYQTLSEVTNAVSAEATIRENADIDLNTAIGLVSNALDGEITNRGNADNSLQGQIDALAASSDVTDIVGTHAQLEAYDTSKLNNNDIIKVLQDETQNDETTYYRWSTSSETFSLIGEEGPYYTKAATDLLLANKQDTLTAGTNIAISSGNVISASFPTMTGATAGAAGTSGAVPAPAAGDQDKVLRGDGTWGTAATQTIFYANSSESGSTRHIYKRSDMTGEATMQDIINANNIGQVILRLSTAAYPETYSDAYLQNAYVANGDYQMLFLNEKAYVSYDTTATTDTLFYYSRRALQQELTAGSGINITGATISTDYNYETFTFTMVDNTVVTKNIAVEAQ